MRPNLPAVHNANGYCKDRFTIDVAAATVTCPAHHTVPIGAAATARPALASSVGLARCGQTAGKLGAGGSSSSTPTRPSCSRPKPAKTTRLGSGPIEKIGPTGNARSAT